VKELLVDTSAYSAYLRGREDVGAALREADLLCVNPVVLGELMAGFRKGSQRRKNEAELKKFLMSPRVDIVDIDRLTSERYAAILEGLQRAGTPVPTSDLWIAATAMQHGLVVVTLDEHFLRIPQILVEHFPVGPSGP